MSTNYNSYIKYPAKEILNSYNITLITKQIKNIIRQKVIKHVNM